MEQANNLPVDDLANEEQIKLGRAKRVGPPRIVPPVASPPLVSFNTLPQHYLWVDWMTTARFGRNLIPSGSFNDAESPEDRGLDRRGLPVRRGQVVSGRRPCPEDEKMDSRKMVKMAVKAGGEAGGRRRARAVLRLPRRGNSVAGGGGQGGSILADLGVRPAARADRRRGRRGDRPRLDRRRGAAIHLARGDPGDDQGGPLPPRARRRRDPTVTLGLAGYGEAFFDDLSVERVEAAAAAPLPEASPASAPRPPAVAPPRRRPPGPVDWPSRVTAVRKKRSVGLVRFGILLFRRFLRGVGGGVQSSNRQVETAVKAGMVPGGFLDPEKTAHLGLTGSGRWGSTPPRLLPVLGRADSNTHL